MMNQATQKTKNIDINIQNMLKCGVVFGTPSRQCKNHGICHMNTIDPEMEDSKLDQIQAISYISYKEDLLAIYFLKSSIKKGINDYHFKNNSFVVIEPFYFDPAISFALGAQQSLMVKQGRYSLDSTDKYYVLLVNCE